MPYIQDTSGGDTWNDWMLQDDLADVDRRSAQRARDMITQDEEFLSYHREKSDRQARESRLESLKQRAINSKFIGPRTDPDLERVGKISARFDEFKKLSRSMSPQASELLFNDLRSEAERETEELRYDAIAKQINGLRGEAFSPNGTPLPVAGDLKILEEAVANRSMKPEQLGAAIGKIGEALATDRVNFMRRERALGKMGQMLNPDALDSWVGEDEYAEALDLYSRFTWDQSLDPDEAVKELREALGGGRNRYSRAMDYARSIYAGDWENMTPDERKAAVKEVGREQFPKDPQFSPPGEEVNYEELYNETIGGRRSAERPNPRAASGAPPQAGAEATPLPAQRVASFTEPQWKGLESELIEAVRSGGDIAELATKWNLSPSMDELMSTPRGRELVQAVTFSAPRGVEGAQPPSPADISERGEDFGEGESREVVDVAEMLSTGLGEPAAREELLARISPLGLSKRLRNEVIEAIFSRGKKMADRPDQVRGAVEKREMRAAESRRSAQEEFSGTPEEPTLSSVENTNEAVSAGPSPSEASVPIEERTSRSAEGLAERGAFALKTWETLDHATQDTLWYELVRLANQGKGGPISEEMKPLLRKYKINAATLPASRLSELRKIRRKSRGGKK